AKSFLSLYPSFFIDGATCWVEFGVESHPDDWNCLACNFSNFHHRTSCHKCGHKRTANVLNDGSEDISALPTPFILIRNLPEDLSESQIFQDCADMSGLKAAWLARDKQTFKSRQFAFLQFDSSSSAKALL